MLQVITVNASNYLGRGVEYTNILYDMVRRNLPEGFEGNFTVFTDTDGEYDDGIIIRPLPYPNIDGWWNKLSLFSEGLFNDGDRLVYIDLSTLITGRLDDIVSYQGTFAILEDFYRPRGLQSAFMAWEANTHSYLWHSWLKAGMPITEEGDQEWIERTIKNYDIWQHLFPNKFSSYKVSNGKIPFTASVVKFHGDPKPHEVLGDWVQQVWKVGGMTRAELDNVCNMEIEELNKNITSSSSRYYLPWFDFDYVANNKQACIVGGGSSLEKSLDELKWRKLQGHSIFATNATHDYLINNGIIPDYHVILDAREFNAEFVNSPKKEVHYLIASQCHPSIFDKLEGYNVTLFHNSTPDIEKALRGEGKVAHLLGGGTTVAMKAILLAELMGYEAIHLYGVDSCYIDDKHHAYKQASNDNERVVDVFYYDKMFKCSGWMASQANDFIDFCQRYLGVITVSGNGLLAYIAKCGIPESASDTRAREILTRVDNDAKGAEIGVFAGDLSSRLLKNTQLSLLMVDSWAEHGGGDYAESGDFHATLTQDMQNTYMQMAINKTKFAENRRKVIKNSSVEASNSVENGSLDFVFIDADHSYNGCKADIKAWYPKVKKGGYLCGHDYSNTDFPCFGVNQAVDEFVVEKGLDLELGDNFTWFTLIT